MANGHFGGGDGTKENPYLVEDALDLFEIADKDDISQMRYSGAISIYTYYRQVNDIDLKDIPLITINITNKAYDGGGYKIKNLTIHNEDNEDEEEYKEGSIGLFSMVSESVLKNIHIVDADIVAVGNFAAGILAGGAMSSLIERCSVSGKIEVSSEEYVYCGGIIAVLYNSTLKTSYADVSLSAPHAGGLVGTVGYAVIQDCYVVGTVHNTSSAGAFVYSYMEGTEFKNCYGVVEMVDVQLHNPIGFFEGNAIDDDIVITNCYINGENGFISEWDETKLYTAGAIVKGTDGALYRCIEHQINFDEIEFPPDWDGNLEGLEIPPYPKAQPVTGELWATHWELYDGDLISTTGLMKQKDTFVGWNFSEIWGIKENETYPYFHLRQPMDKWQTEIKCKSHNLPKSLVP